MPNCTDHPSHYWWGCEAAAIPEKNARNTIIGNPDPQGLP